MDENKDWRDGFLFLANELCLDFLNTCPVLDSGPVELLTDGQAVARWMAAAGLLAKPAKVGGEGVEELQQFREALRRAVFDIEAGRNPGNSFINRLNDLLALYPGVQCILRTSDGLLLRPRFQPDKAADLFAPLAESVARLLTATDRSKIRKCDNCALHFHDTSKKGTRRWCSMQICGNRMKVAAYTARKRAKS